MAVLVEGESDRAAVLALATEAANAVRLLKEPLDRFDTATGLALFLLQAGTLLGVAAGAAWLTHSRRRALRRAISIAASFDTCTTRSMTDAS